MSLFRNLVSHLCKDSHGTCTFGSTTCGNVSYSRQIQTLSIVSTNQCGRIIRLRVMLKKQLPKIGSRLKKLTSKRKKGKPSKKKCFIKLSDFGAINSTLKSTFTSFIQVECAIVMNLAQFVTTKKLGI